LSLKLNCDKLTPNEDRTYKTPQVSGVFEKIFIQEPINLLYIGAYLKKYDIEVCLWDFEVEPFSADIIKQRLLAEKVTICAITSMTPTVKNAHKVAQAVKKTSPHIVTIAGGPHVTALAADSLNEFPCFDIIAIGEGEQTLYEICSAVKNNRPLEDISGIALRKNNKVLITNRRKEFKNIDKLPFPDRRMLDQKLYKNIYAPVISPENKKSSVIFTTRGCPENCVFCAVKKTQGPLVRFRSAENV